MAQDENVSPEWRWIFYKNGDLSAKTHIVSHGRFRLAEFGNLTITGVSAKDIGVYKCLVASSGGNDSRFATLNVIGQFCCLLST